MRAFAAFIVAVLFLIAGVLLGGWLGVHGKKNTITLNTDPTKGQIPVVAPGDIVKWINPYQSQPGPAADIKFSANGGNGPCEKNPTPTGTCKIAKAVKNNYTYGCGTCGDPILSGGSSTLPSPLAKQPGDEQYAERLFSRIAYAFVSFFFPAPSPPEAKEPDHPIAPLPLQTGSPVIISVDCKVSPNPKLPGTMLITDPSQWAPPTVPPVAVGTSIRWSATGEAPSSFLVADTLDPRNPDSLAMACDSASPPPYHSFTNGTTFAPCSLKPGYTGTLQYKVTQDPVIPGACQTPKPFTLEVRNPGTAVPR